MLFKINCMVWVTSFVPFAIVIFPFIHHILSNFFSCFFLHFCYTLRSSILKQVDFWVGVIPKEGWAHVAAPILLLVWHRLSKNIIYDDVSRVKFWKVSVIPKECATRAHPCSSQLLRTLRTFSRNAAQILFPGAPEWALSVPLNIQTIFMWNLWSVIQDT